VLCTQHRNAQADRLAAQGRAAGLSVEVVVVASEQWKELASDRMLVVRPDQMIAWRGTVAANSKEMWARVAGAEQFPRTLL
jgi:hypothetical protein